MCICAFKARAIGFVVIQLDTCLRNEWLFPVFRSELRLVESGIFFPYLFISFYYPAYFEIVIYLIIV